MADRRVLLIAGGDDKGTLYGAYRFAEKLGVRFYLHGDVVSDRRIEWKLPTVDEIGKPLFNVRGIQPFHDFPEGPDWWNRDDYLAHVSQLAKMRMNFLGLHCYPEGGVGPEPGVWIGLSQDLDPQSRVKFSYPSQWANTARAGMWGYAAMKTGDFCGGADQLFAADNYGPDVMDRLMPSPATPEQSNRLFDNAGDQFHTVFAEAKALGVKTCIGTETPLTIPKPVQERLKQLGKDPKDPAVMREVYQGMFRRIAQLFPVDYYWLWTPEGWTWSGNKPEEFEATVTDIKAALGALKDLNDPFTLATSGWVLGPVQDRAALDRFLPKNIPMSCINREVGHDRVDPAFGQIQNRPKWAIPWMENDPELVSAQPYVGRMRYDAVDALRYGCDGLLGIHWRTKAMAQNVSALASACWDQSWKPDKWEFAAPARKELGALNGEIAQFGEPVQGTSESIIYQTVRYNTDGYDLGLPNGVCSVTLQFNEPFYDAPGKRVFGVAIQGRAVVERLDMFERVGKNKALDMTFRDIPITDGHLRIQFTRIVEFPAIAGIVIELAAKDAAKPIVRKINCGGNNEYGYESDEWSEKPTDALRRRSMPTLDFYEDFARANFGEDAAKPVGALLARIDGLNLPQTSTWLDGPGGIVVRSWPEKDFAFVDELQALRALAKGAGDRERFDYWLNTYRILRAHAKVATVRSRLDALMNEVAKVSDAAVKKAKAGEALAVRLQLARDWEQLISMQVAATDTPGELGTIANLEQHNRKLLKFLGLHDEKLSKALQQPLPAEVEPGKTFRGPARLIVPTVRGSIASGQQLKLRVMAVDAVPVRSVELHWRPLGRGGFKVLPAQHEGRAVYSAVLPESAQDVEYYLSATTATGATLVWPVTAPELCQTVVVTEASVK
jgi:hypothetical protein